LAGEGRTVAHAVRAFLGVKPVEPSELVEPVESLEPMEPVEREKKYKIQAGFGATHAKWLSRRVSLVMRCTRTCYGTVAAAGLNTTGTTGNK
jgi:hypothetical protein